MIDHGEFAVRGSIVDIFPSSLDAGLRLDFFGDELESLRLFDPATQLTIERIDSHLLLPASEALLDEDSIKRFRGRYREQFGANATQDPLYEAVSDGRRLAGMEHWLPLFEERLATLFDHIAPHDLVVIDQGALGAVDERLTDIADYQTRSAGGSRASGREAIAPLGPDALYLTRAEIDAALAAAPAHRATGFVSEGTRQRGRFRLPVRRAISRPERGRGENVYEAAAAHLKAVAKAGRKPLFAAYSNGSARRIASILEEAGAPTVLADGWQQGLGLAAKSQGRSAGVCRSRPALPMIRSNSFTEADVLGDRLVAAQEKNARIPTPSSPNFRRCRAANLVVHIEHGIGKYLGLEPIAVGKSPA